ncbi:MAG: PQQ-binding-like beta-propeller repeat protein [Gammaproteobacteria bacterium]
MNPAHTGAVTFASMSFPSNPTWSVNFVNPPSYALIVDGKVIVTVGLFGFTSEMYALDQATGNTVWGPISINGFSDATYDNGRVFAVCASISSTSTVEAFDVNTGALDWSTPVPSVSYISVGAPTAANGIVYIGGSNNGGMLNALDESTGTLLWTQPVQYGDDSAPALTADGLYVSYPCQTYDFRPATGETIWHNNTGCAASGGGTPVAANQFLYSPDWQSGDTGDVFNTETGASEGTYTTNSIPAFTASMGYFLQSGTLVGITLADNTVQWSFSGDGQLIGAPIVVNQYVFIGSSSGNLYALDGTTGVQVWNVNLGTAIGSNVYSVPLSGLAAGDGLLVVPAGTTLTAYTLSTNP